MQAGWRAATLCRQGWGGRPTRFVLSNFSRALRPAGVRHPLRPHGPSLTALKNGYWMGSLSMTPTLPPGMLLILVLVLSTPHRQPSLPGRLRVTLLLALVTAGLTATANPRVFYTGAKWLRSESVGRDSAAAATRRCCCQFWCRHPPAVAGQQWF